NIPELIRQQQQQREAKTRVQEAAARAIARQQAQKTAEQARRHELARIQAARDQLLERLPPDVARVLEVSMPPLERELDREPATPGSGMTRAGREARAKERERGRDARER